MLLAVDIGNSNIKFGVFDSETLISKFSIPSDLDAAGPDLKSAVGSSLDFPITRSIVCSVVPPLDHALAQFLNDATGIDPIFIKNDFDFGLKIMYEPISALGTDRLINAYSAAEKYGVPCIVCSFGTATTFDAVNKDRFFLGGVIAPGMKTMARALHLNTAQLPEVDIDPPASVIGNTTSSSIRSGIFYGQIAMAEGLIGKIKKEMSDNPRVVATGGFASMIADRTSAIDVVDDNLLLEGLRRLSSSG